MKSSISHGRFKMRNASMAACNSMRLLVVCAALPEISFTAAPQRKIAAHPPGLDCPGSRRRYGWSLFARGMVGRICASLVHEIHERHEKRGRLKPEMPTNHAN